MKQRIRKTNQIYLITVLIIITASLLPVYQYLTSYTARLLFSQIVLSVPGAVYLLAGRKNYADAVRLKRLRLGTVLWLVLFTICIMPFMSMVNAVSMLFVEDVTTSSMSEIITGNSYLVSLFLIAFVPCVLEESVYRGLFYNEYRKVSPLRGMLLSGLLFGLMHGNLNQFSYAFLMGIVFALVIEATDSILASMIMHFLINGYSATVMAVMAKLDEGLVKDTVDTVRDEETLTGIILDYLPFAVIGLLVSIVVYRLIAASEGRLEYIKVLFRLPKASRRRAEQQALREIRRLQEDSIDSEQNGRKTEEQFPASGSDIPETEQIYGLKDENTADSAASEPDALVFSDPGEERQLRHAGEKQKPADRTRLLTAPLMIGMAICAAIMILNEIL